MAVSCRQEALHRLAKVEGVGVALLCTAASPADHDNLKPKGWALDI